MAPKIDAVVVSTSDHTHAPAAVMAMRPGEPVYCQKPQAHSAFETRLMRETAAERKVATQMGNQGTANPGFRSGIELIRSGVVWPVREVHVWANRPFKYWKQAPDIVARPPEMPVPPHVVWHLFLGPAPERPYIRSLTRTTGEAGGTSGPARRATWPATPPTSPSWPRSWACRPASRPRAARSTPRPTPPGPRSPPSSRRGATLPPVKLTWYGGARDGKRHLSSPDLFQGKVPTDSGSLLVGEKDSIFSPSDNGAEQVILGAGESGKKPKDSTEAKPKNNDDSNHKAEWLRAIREGNPSIALSNFAYSGVLTEARAPRLARIIEVMQTRLTPCQGRRPGRPPFTSLLLPDARRLTSRPTPSPSCRCLR